MARAVERGIDRRDARAIAHLGIDEKSFGKGQVSFTVLTDIDGSRVVEKLQVGQNQLRKSFFATSQTSNAEVSEPSL